MSPKTALLLVGTLSVLFACSEDAGATNLSGEAEGGGAGWIDSSLPAGSGSIGDSGFDARVLEPGDADDASPEQCPKVREVLWYRDCDGDGYAPAVEAKKSCQRPIAEGGCGWTLRQPSSRESTDCDDKRAARFPGAPFGVPDDWLSAEAADACDLNCDGRVEASDQAVALWDGLRELGPPLPLCGDGVKCPCLEHPIVYDQLAYLYGYPAMVRLSGVDGACAQSSQGLVMTLCR